MQQRICNRGLVTAFSDLVGWNKVDKPYLLLRNLKWFNSRFAGVIPTSQELRIDFIWFYLSGKRIVLLLPGAAHRILEGRCLRPKDVIADQQDCDKRKDNFGDSIDAQIF